MLQTTNHIPTTHVLICHVCLMLHDNYMFLIPSLFISGYRELISVYNDSCRFELCLLCLHLSLLFAMNNSDLDDLLQGEDVVDDISLDHISMVFSLQKNFSNFSFFPMITTLLAVINGLCRFIDRSINFYHFLKPAIIT